MYDSDFYKHKGFAFAMLILIIGGINVSYTAFYKIDLLTQVLGKKSIIPNMFYILLGIVAISIAFSRETYLPFLGPSVVPCSILPPSVPENADFEAKIQTDPGKKVLYWAAEPKNNDLHTIHDWKEAYLQFRNAGVAIADEQGNAILRVRKPQPYTVPIKGELSPHIHYRICNDNGFIGTVETIQVNENEYFQNYVSAQESNESLQDPPPAPELTNPTPNDAISYLNKVASDTLQNSKMAESGAFDESVKRRGSDFEEAYYNKLY